MKDLKMIPYRLCCGQQHVGPVCPDGLVMCCYCFERVSIEDLASKNGDKIDVCILCWDWEQKRLDCIIRPFSSRVCSMGTKSCENMDHDTYIGT